MRRKRSKNTDIIQLFIMVVVVLIAITWFRIKLHVAIPPETYFLLIGLLVVVSLMILLTPSGKRRRKFKAQPNMNEIDRMTGEDFEDALAYTLKRKGWRVETTKKSGDYGADLIGIDHQGRKIVVQAKRWKNTVGVDAVQQVIGARAYYKAERALVITNQHLTKSAWHLARETGVEVWSRKRLQAEIQSSPKHREVTPETRQHK